MSIQLILNEHAKNGVPVKIYTTDVEQSALNQLYALSQLQFIHSHIAVMPDVHAGKGATVGSVIPTKSAIIPAAVGVDIGCGMNALRLSIKACQLPDNLKTARLAIEKHVPVGFAKHKQIMAKMSTLDPLAIRLKRITDKHKGLLKMLNNFERTWAKQLGTLGGGNHFIELCVDENQDVWIMLHSGSRGIGSCIGEYFITLAKKENETRLGYIPDRDLSYFAEGSAYFDDYIEAVGWAQDYAMENRKEMMRLIIKALQSKDAHFPHFTITKEAINCHHNYVSQETHFGQDVYVTRKGAISAYDGELGIIPGSMGAKSYIVRGKGNRESFCSCSHGAGRAMSRGKAMRQFNVDDLKAQTSGVECRKDKGVLDEIPQAYKDIDVVMDNQRDLVEVVHTLKQVMCIKG
ncbi:RtcB family protein [Moraxella sp. VT-16-12]|uniref:RtcB family protein n=1 Tax=Moraxella sp. VT-16-12 TaxID=2014877 RepID=UPI000B7D31C2|nr:RtcB family protein [Moraxella sp. VT-16-12]TWV84802.1 RtcB family protein [Moraxella sp. VT-16-12]